MSDKKGGSKIFVGYRALGFVCDHLPLVLRYIKRRKEHLVVTAVGRTFHTYGCSKLSLLSVSAHHDDEIGCIAGDSHLIYTACQNQIYSWRRGRELQRIYNGHKSPVKLLLPFATHLLSVDEENVFIIWEIKSGEIYLERAFDTLEFNVTTLLHPITYVNKILLGSEQGALQLWNIHTDSLIYLFPGWNSPVTALEQTPAVDVVAVGLKNGEIYIHNLKFDETLMKFSQEWGPVTGISFRTDGPPYMATGSTAGHIAIWDLEKQSLQNQITNAHGAPVTGLQFLPDEPLLLTSSPDNSLKVWIFDLPDDGGRLLKHQQGHRAPPSRIRFHGSTGKNILSSGLDSTLRSFSTVADNLNKSLGQASYDRKKAKRKGVAHDTAKMPPVIDFTSETTREKEWDNIAACHRDLPVVTTWSYDHCCMGQHKLIHERFKGKTNIMALCVALSACGNFVLIGYSSGHVDRYNIQSGIHRMSYGMEQAHDGAVRGVATDSLNQMVVTGGADNKIKFWRFKENKLLSEISLDSSVSKFHVHKESAMLAVSLDNFTILIIDLELRRSVRKFSNFYSQVTDMTFSPDARWLITSSTDSLVRTWDLPTGCLIDCFQVPAPCTSIDMSPSGDYLATVHADDLGIYLWSNTTLYSHVSLHPLPADFIPQVAELPASAMYTTSDKELRDSDIEEMDLESYQSPSQIEDLITLSSLPYSRWQNLLNIDVVKQRNKPKEPPKAPKAAPFFLPTVAGLDPKFKLPDKEKSDTSQIIYKPLQTLSSFGKVIMKSSETKDYKPVVEQLKEMGPSTIDFELRSLPPEAGGSQELMFHFMKAMEEGLRSRKDFELIQSYLGLFLKIHADSLASDDDLHGCLSALSETQELSWKELQHTFHQTLCIVNYLKSAIL